MRGDKRLDYWDACIFIAWIRDETAIRGEEAMRHIREMVREAKAGQSVIVSSVVSIPEILNGELDGEQIRMVENLENFPWIQFVETTIPMARKAHELRDYYRANPHPSGAKTPSTPDMVHLATALELQAVKPSLEAFYTFDAAERRGKCLGLIPMSGNVAGKYDLRIEKPYMEEFGGLFV